MVLHPWLWTLNPAGNISSSPTLQTFQGASPFAMVALTHQSYLLDHCPLTSACSGQQTHKGMFQKRMSNIVTGQNGLPFPTFLLTHTFTFVKQCSYCRCSNSQHFGCAVLWLIAVRYIYMYLHSYAIHVCSVCKDVLKMFFSRVLLSLIILTCLPFCTANVIERHCGIP